MPSLASGERYFMKVPGGWTGSLDDFGVVVSSSHCISEELKAPGICHTTRKNVEGQACSRSVICQHHTSC